MAWALVPGPGPGSEPALASVWALVSESVREGAPESDLESGWAQVLESDSAREWVSVWAQVSESVREGASVWALDSAPGWAQALGQAQHQPE